MKLESVPEHSFCWRDISVWKRKEQPRGFWQKTAYRDVQVVKSASGFLSEGSLMAIMGPSGSGKTTLLSAISRRNTAVRGSVFVNGRKMNADEMLILSGFVPQDDLTMQNLTVEEHFKIMAALKMDRNLSLFHRTDKISSIMKEMGIRDVATSYLSDLSGGEKRRLSIAVQMLTDPIILFCDEPTTGLDSANATVVVKMLKSLTLEGKIIICSIHQPTAAIYELFDRVLLLASGGRTAFFGSVPQALDHYNEFGLVCPPHYNIAEFLINSMSLNDFHADERVEQLCRHYSESKLKGDLEVQIGNCISDSTIGKTKRVNEINRLLFERSLKKPTLKSQTLVLIQRLSKNTNNNLGSVAVSVAVQLFICCLTIAVYGKVTLCGEDSIQNVKGIIHTTSTAMLFYALAYGQQGILDWEKAFMLREVNNGLYRLEAYCMAKLFIKLVHSLVISVFYVMILTYILEAFTHVSFWNLLIPYFLTSTIAIAYGCTLASIFDDLNMVLLVCFIYDMINAFLNGIYSNISSLPIIFQYLRFLSIQFYYLEYLQVMEWKEALNQNIRCENTTGQENLPLIALQKLASSGYDVQYYWKDLWILVLLCTLLFAACYSFLRKKK